MYLRLAMVNIKFSTDNNGKTFHVNIHLALSSTTLNVTNQFDFTKSLANEQQHNKWINGKMGTRDAITFQQLTTLKSFLHMVFTIVYDQHVFFVY